MDNFMNFNIETIVALLFGITALTTVAMSVWAYAYQRIRESRKDLNIYNSERGTEGRFFVRVKPEIAGK